MTALVDEGVAGGRDIGSTKRTTGAVGRRAWGIYGRDPRGSQERRACASLHEGFNLHPPAKNAENSLSKKLPRRLEL